MLFGITTLLIFYTETLIISSVSNLPLNFKNLSTNIIDFNIRNKLTESVLGTFYYCWTNFWVIYLMISLLSLVFITKLYNNVSYITLVSLVFMVLAMLIFHDIYFNIHFAEPIKYSKTQFNMLLQNKMNRYHPLLLYLSIYFVLKPKLFKTSKAQINSIPYLITILISICWGGWWAYQEGSWGGWWDWDASELLSIVIMLVFVSNIHNKFSTNSVLIYNYGRMLRILFFFLTYSVLQAGFAVTLHNFGTLNTDYFTKINHYIWFIYLILLLITSLLSLSSSTMSKGILLNYNIYGCFSVGKQKWKHILTLLSIHIFLTSFILLFNNGLQSVILTYIQVISTSSFHELSFMILLILILLHSTLNHTSILLLLSTAFISKFNTLLLTLVTLNKNLRFNIHVLILGVLFIPILDIYYFTDHKVVWPSWLPNYYISDVFLLPTFINYTLDNTYITELVNITLNKSDYGTIGRNFKLLSEADEAHKHFHLANRFSYNQYWWSFNRRFNIFKNTVEVNLGLIITLLTTIISSLLTLSSKKKIITF